MHCATIKIATLTLQTVVTSFVAHWHEHRVTGNTIRSVETSNDCSVF